MQYIVLSGYVWNQYALLLLKGKPICVIRLKFYVMLFGVLCFIS